MKPKSRKLKFLHKWIGLILSFFLIMFALSGIFLNHRQAITSIDVPRSILPEEFRFKNWNKGSIKGAIELTNDSILLYGANGIWLTDSTFSDFTAYKDGFNTGADNQIVGSIVKTSIDEFFAISTYNLYQLDKNGNKWIDISHNIECDERLSDLTIHNDSLILMSRSHIFISTPPYTNFEKKEISVPDNFKNEVSWFRTIWTLHSGELFGLVGKLIVDFVGVITIILCFTGIILMFFPKLIKRSKIKNNSKNKRKRGWLRESLKWHNKLGASFILLFSIVILSGMFLRPPLLIAIIRGKSKPIPKTVLDNRNLWHDKLRTIRYDDFDQSWILYSSDGFFSMKSLNATPQKIQKAPPVSVMGLNILHKTNCTKWVVGSFSGIYTWDKKTGESVDFYTGKPYIAKHGMPTVDNAVAGYIDLSNQVIVFHYGNGAQARSSSHGFPAMPQVFEEARMSLWYLSLEIHTGRIYTFLPNIVGGLFIFLMGVFSLLVFFSGYIIYRKHYKRKKVKTKSSI